MAHHSDQDDDDQDDPEFPDESDMDQDDDDDDDPDTEPRPDCRCPVYADAQICPHCGSYIFPKLAPRRKLLWIALAIALIAILICWTIIASPN